MLPALAFAWSTVSAVAQEMKALPPDAIAHIEKARHLIGRDLPQTTVGEFFNLLRNSKKTDPKILPANPTTAGPLGKTQYEAVGPVKVFDGVYVVGNAFVDVWIFVTKDGIIQYDAMNNEDDAKNIIEPAYAKLGLDPRNLKYIIISHGHGDHFGGAKYFQQKYGTHVLSSAADWDLMYRNVRSNAPPPARDMVVTDGQKLSLGGQTMTLYVTPGHTPGPVSLVVPVTDRGQKHVMAAFGGFGLPLNVEPSSAGPGLRVYGKEMRRFQKIAAAAGADGIISTHPGFDGTEDHVRNLIGGTAKKRNPYVVGNAAVARYWDAVDQIRLSMISIVDHLPAP
ncbi:beta-lactamase domain protein (plasmid) [Novosphingobium sp. PP1Y]|nr:beta-lactamase domain protein [Novosphingobium sp. PP1Y]